WSVLGGRCRRPERLDDTPRGVDPDEAHSGRRVAVRLPARHVHRRDPPARPRLRRLSRPQPERGARCCAVRVSGAGDRGPRRRAHPQRSRRPGVDLRDRDRPHLPLLDHAAPPQAATARVRTWEVAGTAHADTYLIVLTAGAQDLGTSPDIVAPIITSAPIPGLLVCGAPVNSGPQHFVLNAA